MATHLHSFRRITAPHRRSQGALLHWLARAHARADALTLAPPASGVAATESETTARYEKLLHRLSGYSGQATSAIGHRGSFITEFEQPDFDAGRVYKLTKENGGRGATIHERMKVFSECVTPVFEELYAAPGSLPSHLLHVTCTGYVAPSPAQRFLSERGHQHVDVTHAYHMGCYAALPAIRAAGALARDLRHGVDVVHTELCSLHLDPTVHSPEQLVVQSLFGDGAIAYRVSERVEGLQVLAVKEALVPGTLDAMTWLPSAQGLTMTLSSEVPARIAAHLPRFVDQLLGADFRGRALSDFAFAVHPGGPRIIDGVKAALGLSEAQVTTSREVLREFGNLSSATLPHIWQRQLDPTGLPVGTPIISLAFGPGLTIFGLLAMKVSHERAR